MYYEAVSRRGVMRYLEVFYNRRRPHGGNGGLPPATATARFQAGSSRLPAAA